MKISTVTMILGHSFLCVAMGQRGELALIQSAHKDGRVSISTSFGHRLIEVRESLIEGTAPDKRAIFGNLLILFDTESHCYWWQFMSTSGSPKDRLYQMEVESTNKSLLAYSEETRLIIFRSTPLGAVFVREATDKAMTMNEAERRAVKAAAKHPGSFTMSPFEDWVHVSLMDLGLEFTVSRDAPTYIATKLLAIRKVDGKLELLIENRGKAKVILSGDFMTIEANLLQ